MIFQSFKLSKADKILPGFATSFVFEFYQRGNTLNNTSEYDRSNYYIRILLDEKPLDMPEAKCDSKYRCSWDSVAAYLESRVYTKEQIDTICFSHLDYQSYDGNSMPYWLAFLIAFPLVVATLIVYRCLFGSKKKQS